jgi:hypothetical protein
MVQRIMLTRPANMHALVMVSANSTGAFPLGELHPSCTIP